jgi:hypothetical protein
MLRPAISCRINRLHKNCQSYNLRWLSPTSTQWPQYVFSFFEFLRSSQLSFYERQQIRTPPVKLLPLSTRKRILVTGGAGFVGSHLVDRLSMLLGHEVTVFDNFFSGSKTTVSHWIGDPSDKEDAEIPEAILKWFSTMWSNRS